MNIKLARIILMVLLACSVGQQSPAAADGERHWPADEIIRTWLTRDVGLDDSGHVLATAMQRFYGQREFHPVWVSPEGVTPQGAFLLHTLNGLQDGSLTGLNHYIDHLEHLLADAIQSGSVDQDFALQPLLEAEVGMTQIALYFAVQLNPELEIAGDGIIAREPASKREIAGMLANALAGSDWEALLQATYPRQKPYLALKKSLERYQAIAQLGGWPVIPAGPKIGRGHKDPRVPLIRDRLMISGDMGPEEQGADDRLDAALAGGVRRFQARHGLMVDGVVAALNIPVEDRIAQIKINLLPWYRLPDPLGPRYLMVNIPGFKLDVVEDHRVVHSMRAIVGKKERRTPVMSSVMTYLEINPYWNIPQKIACEDILPQILSDPQILVRRHIQVFDSWNKNAAALDPLAIDWPRYSADYFPFRLRQAPAVFNALGQVKFMFPNRFSVYIHDTPAKSLFKKTERSFSSGCVRIEDPVTLAEYLLAGQRWDRNKIQERIERRKNRAVPLKEPIPVHLVYLTAWTDENGTVHFYRDLYERHPHLWAQLNATYAELPALLAHPTITPSSHPPQKASVTASKNIKQAIDAGSS